MSKTIRIGTLFSGIGAPEQGAMRVYDKVEHVFACEYDKFARQSFSAIYDIDQDHFHNDVLEMDGKQYRGKLDVLVGGSPCQAFSIAGLREGTEDERGQLIYQYIRIVEECMAPVIVYENVKGMLSISGGRTIKEFVQALRDIGYFCHYEVVNTKDYGVPQNRERVFLVGFLDGDQYLRFKYAKKQELDRRLKDVLESVVDEKYYLSDDIVKEIILKESDKQYVKIERWVNKQTGSVLDDICPSLRASNGTDIRKMPRVHARYIHFDKESKIRIPSWHKEGFVEIGYGDSINLAFMNNPNSRSTCRTYGLANTLNTACNQAVVLERIRKLTPLECWRLQDFPDTAFQKAKDAGLSDSQLYKQSGNSMSRNVLEMIFRQIEASKFKSLDTLF